MGSSKWLSSNCYLGESGRIIHLNVKWISTNYFPNFCVEVCDNDTIRIWKHKIFLMTWIPESMFILIICYIKDYFTLWSLSIFYSNLNHIFRYVFFGIQWKSAWR